MVTIEKDLYVAIRETRNVRAPAPEPLQSGFSENLAYRVLGLHSTSESGEAYLILPNDRE